MIDQIARLRAEDGRDIREELARRVRQDNSFVTRVLEQPKIWMIGGESDLAA